VLAAVLELARRGGYDAIQIRTISDETGVSTHTIYRYFGSRDRLISAAVRDWFEREFFRPAPTWFEGETPAEQLLSYVRRVWQVWERSPRMLETYIRAALAEGPLEDGLAARATRELEPLTARILSDLEPAYRDDVLMMISHSTHSVMTHVVRGQLPIDEVYPQLERAVRRLAQHPAMAGLRPKAWDWKPNAARRRA
jgi:AcrR family transcriptional regulator